MTKSIDSTSHPQSEVVQAELPWWNRPVMGEGGLLSDLIHKVEKESVPEEVVQQRKRYLLDLLVFAKTAQAIDSDKFANDEFISFVKTKYMLFNGLGDYAGLDESIRLLQLAINAKDSFIAIDQTELRYRGYKQQEFYDFVQVQLQDIDKSQGFRQAVMAKSAEILPLIKTEEGKNATQAYTKHLERISENPLGLQLLSLFKAFQLADYSVLRTIANIIQDIEAKHVHDLDNLTRLVEQNYDTFHALRKIIKLTDQQDVSRCYAVMVQYIALSHRHEISYLKFEELMKVLRKWNYNYQAIQKLMSDYPASHYKLPKEFSDPIPGSDIYFKYQKWLTDKRTGMTYFDMGETIAH